MDCFMNFVDPEERLPSQSQKTLYYCPKCLHGFTLKSNRNRHFRYECGHEPRFKFLLYGSYGVGLYDSTKPDPSQSIRVSPIRRRGSGRRNHVCPKCGNGYTVIKSLRRHLRYECGLTPRFKCPYCGTRSKQRGHVSQHIRRKHSDAKMIKLETMCLQSMCEVVMEESQNFSYEEEKPLNSTRRRRGGHVQDDIERHTCSRCSKSYIHAWHLKRHTKFECGQEPRVQCPYCSAKMKQRGHVYRHIRQYARSVGYLNCQRVTYPCRNCGKVYSYYSSLARHLKHECGVEPKFHCPLCPYRTKHKSSLNTHLNGRHMKLLSEFYTVPNGNKTSSTDAGN
ncbi:hypothetical protein ALC56_13437 [Trachymyrmex septentrionalis]|uniref:C2H2-type domain-containing protein n=1 Tax=Trachymyrmex septentrionalis TaxID=34720 RepID=A0A195EUX1_9HYME|nr:hypothetical protein ALC56_13437 [Trachymyrmex septentrionalis]